MEKRDQGEDRRGRTIMFKGHKQAEIQRTDRNELRDTKICILSELLKSSRGLVMTAILPATQQWIVTMSPDTAETAVLEE